MSETPDKPRLPIPLPPRVNLSESPPPAMQFEMVEKWRSRQLMRLLAWNGVLDYFAEMSMIDPDKFTPSEIIYMMRESSEFQAELSSGKIALLVASKNLAEPGESSYAVPDEECDRVMDELLTEVSANSLEQIKGVRNEEYVPGARKRPLQEPVQAKLRGRPKGNIPPITGEPQITEEPKIGEQSAGSSPSRTVKVRRVAKTPPTGRS